MSTKYSYYYGCGYYTCDSYYYHNNYSNSCYSPNVAPVANNDCFTGCEDKPVVIAVSSLLSNDTDKNGDKLTVTAVQGALNGSVSLVNGYVTFTPIANYNGPASFTYTVSDGKGSTSTATVNLSLSPVNDAPDAVNDNITVMVPGVVTIDPAILLANDKDVDGDKLTIVSVQCATNGSVALVNGKIIFTPAAGYSGPATFTYTISDGKGGCGNASSDTATVCLTIPKANVAPDAVNDGVIVGNEDVAFVINMSTLLANDTDANGDKLTVTAVQAALHGDVAINANGQVVFTPEANYNGPASFTYTISDGKGGVDTATVSLNICPVNDAPEAFDDSFVASSTTPFVMSVSSLLTNDKDVEADGLSINSVQDGTGGKVTLVGNNVVFTPALGFSGIATFTYTIVDGKGATDTATVTLDVLAPANLAPNAVGDSLSGKEGSELVITTFDLLANDTDAENNPLTVTNVQNAVNGSVSIDLVTNQVKFIPTPNYSGPASFTYTISDGKGGESTAVVNLTIEPVANQAFTPSVSEEGLFGGSPDTFGVIDITDSAVFTGTFTFANPNGTTALTLNAPTTTLTAGGEQVVWEGNGTQTLTASVAGNHSVATLTIDNSGKYTFTLLAPVDHPVADVEDVINLNFGVALTDGAFVANKTLSINIEDDMPSAKSNVQEVAMIDTNLLITLDVSGSMTDPSGIAGLSRIQSAVQSIKNLIDIYDGFGQVSVRLVTFSSNAQAVGDKWFTVEEAKLALDNLGTSGVTNYDAALGATIDAYGAAGKFDNAQVLSYVFSDGDPNRGRGNATDLNGNVNNASTDVGIQTDEETTWKNFLTQNQIKSFAIGMGTDIATPETLNPIAYDGQSQVDINAVVVTSFANLDAVLANTVTTTNTSGLLDLGSDTGYLKSVTIEGVTYSFNNENNSIEVTGGVDASVFNTLSSDLTISLASGAQYVISMNSGAYEYLLPPNVVSTITETFDYLASDIDGDTVGATNTLVVSKTNVTSGTTASDELIGTALPDLIYGREGDDTISGGAGKDKLIGGDGNDTIYGGEGNDSLVGGLGADTFAWELADAGSKGAAAYDAISDFDVTSGGDVLDLRDLLVSENHASGIGNLADFLHFEKAGADTIVHVSSAGEFAAGFNSANDVQAIALLNVDLVSGLSNDQAVIQDLLTKNKLTVD